MKVNYRHIGFYLCLSGSLVYAADVQAPSAEFWQYLLEFSNENGEVIDPMEFAQLHQLPDNADAQQTAISSTSNPHSSAAAEE